ncbi:Uncharacterised protein [Chlamydia trachomatis]|nr:Uncharacterised protein [Chlamydia trachomatis]
MHGRGVTISPEICITSSPKLYGCIPSQSFAGSIASIIFLESTPFGKGNCTIKPVQEGSLFNFSTAVRISYSLASSGKSHRIERIPTSSQSLCFPATYFNEPGSLPTKSVPSPGLMPFSLSFSTLFFKSLLILAASAFPSNTTTMIHFPARMLILMFNLQII